jgi:hypothetical protein
MPFARASDIPLHVSMSPPPSDIADEVDEGDKEGANYTAACNVRGISLVGVSLLVVHEKTGKLYWDGKEIVTRSIFKLDTFERWLATIRPILWCYPVHNKSPPFLRA